MFKKLATLFESFVSPYPRELPQYSGQNLLAFIWECCFGVKKYIGAIVFFTALAGMVEALTFYLLGQIANRLGDISPAQLWDGCSSYIITLFTLLCFSPLIIAGSTLFKFQTLQGNFPMLLRWNFHRLILNQEISFFHNEFAGRITNKVMQTAMAVRDIVIAFFDICIFVCIYFISSAVVLASFDTWLLLPFIIWLVLYILICYYFLPKLTHVAKEQANERSNITGYISDLYTNIHTVKLFAHNKLEHQYALKLMKQFMNPVHGQQRLVSGFDLSIYTLSMLMILSTSSIALWLWMHGKVGIGVFTAATAMSMRFNNVSQWAMWVVADLFEHIGTAQDGMQMFTSTVSSATNTITSDKDLQVTKGAIQFKNVKFAYNQSQNILSNFNLSIAPGEKVGLVGRSGAGKSTIINLLLRLHDITDGKIVIDGQNIQHLSPESVRNAIGMVTQDTSLLHRSIKDNILYGRPEASHQEMLDAAIKAEANMFIETLEDNQHRQAYDVHVGERGAKLSGGQKQRISIARVILKNAPILLLDEATSALDSEAEIAIQNSLYTIMQNKTVIAIAHRLSTIAAMDRLIIIEQGRIIEEGSHQELLQKRGVYSQLWAHQHDGFI